jgi:hypothetical protein
MFHCMLSYRQATDKDLATKLHHKLHTLLAAEDRSSNSLQRTGSGGAPPPSSPTRKIGWGGVAKAVMNRTFASIVEGGSKIFPFQGETSFPPKFTRCAEAQTSDFHVFLDKVCLKNGEQWQGTGKPDDGGFIGAILQSLVFVPVLSVKQINSSGGFEELSSAPDKTNADKLEGSLGRLIRLNTTHDDRQQDGDNVLLELIIAKALHTVARQFASSSGKFYPCFKILPLLAGNDKIHDCKKQLSDKPHIATNNKAVEILQKAGLTDAFVDKLKNESVQSIVNWYFRQVPCTIIPHVSP